MSRWFPVVVLSLAGCPKPVVEVAPPSPGWHTEPGWAGACWFPVDFEAQAGGARRIARSDAIGAIVGQWRGERTDGVQFDEVQVRKVETTLLGHPERVEALAVENYAQCRDFRTRGGDTSRWGAWLVEVGDRIREGDCPHRPLDYTLFDYLSITTGWQITTPICQGNDVLVKGSGIDKFRLTANGPWITLAGDPAQSALGSPLPCNIEGCFRGQLVLQYEGIDGYRTVVPIGLETRFTAPGHGRISVMINDDSWSDNSYFVENGMAHHASVTLDGEH
jgi:hypothetical protein